MTQDTCPLGLVRHSTRPAAQNEANRRTTTMHMKKARFRAVHCPDCGGFHTVLVTNGALRQRNPRQRARLARAASYGPVDQLSPSP